MQIKKAKEEQRELILILRLPDGHVQMGGVLPEGM
jgi:hypothetical protein